MIETFFELMSYIDQITTLFKHYLSLLPPLSLDIVYWCEHLI